MKLSQLSLFIQNQPGAIAEPCRILAENNINIYTMTLAETNDYGVLRLIVKEWQKARDVLAKAGFTANLTDVVAVKVPNQPGGLAEVLEKMGKIGINVVYMYAFVSNLQDAAVIIFRFDKTEEVIKQLTEASISIVNAETLFS